MRPLLWRSAARSWLLVWRGVCYALPRLIRKFFALIWLTTLFCGSCAAEEIGIFKTVSPKLKQFLVDHSAASNALVGAISESFSNRTVQLYYFYSDDEAQPRA